MTLSRSTLHPPRRSWCANDTNSWTGWDGHKFDIDRDHDAYLDAADVSATLFEDATALLPKLAEYIQAPSVSLSNQAENGREVVGETDETEPTAVNQPRSLEDLTHLLSDDSSPALCLHG